jgi:hypothetical protein
MRLLSTLHGSPHASRTLLCALAISTFAALLLGLSTAVPARADGPGIGTPWIVSLGDSSISGEAGRWAGNTNDKYTEVDALGSTAYYDNAGHTAELIPGCHRSQSAEVYIGNTIEGENLACSGAETSSYTAGSVFKPGLDFYNSGGHEGQALMLEKFAKEHNVTLVPIAIGANNFNFSELVTFCVARFILSDGACNEQPTVTNNFTAKNIETQTTKIKEAILNVSEAMKKAGYTTSQYTILVQNYTSGIPNGTEIRYPETVAERQEIGGCGLYDADALAANQTMLVEINKAELTAAEDAKLPNLKTLNIATALNGRRLCEKGVGLLEEEGLSSWKEPGAVNKTEWVSMVRTPSIAPLASPPYELQEDGHPNYWGQLALRDCLTKAYNGGKPIGGTCTIEEEGLNTSGEPKMALSTWTKEETVNPSSEENELGEVSCWSTGKCVAVGLYVNTSKHESEPLVERLSGGTWTQETAPLPTLAVGGGNFNGVSCPTKEFCMASGVYINSAGRENAFADEYTSAGGWKELSPSLPGPGQSQLDRVSCPTSEMCMLVGVYESLGELLPYAQKWTSAHGSTLEYPPGASQGVLLGVSCLTAEECMAVGWTNGTVLSDEWSGGTWTRTKSASSSYSPVKLYGVDCVMSALEGCTGAGWGTSSGTELTMSEEWTKAGGWVTASTQDPSTAKNKLWAVGCWEKSKCIGVGEESKSPKEAALIERLEGRWSTVETPAPVTGAESSRLGGISCQQEKDANCTAVGWYVNKSGQAVTLAESNQP